MHVGGADGDQGWWLKPTQGPPGPCLGRDFVPLKEREDSCTGGSWVGGVQQHRRGGEAGEANLEDRISEAGFVGHVHQDYLRG